MVAIALSDLRWVVGIVVGLVVGVIVTPSPYAVVVVVLTIAWVLAALLWRWFGFHNAPHLRIAVDPVERVGVTERAWLEWPHIAVTNIGQSRAKTTVTALAARATVRFDGKGARLRLRWDSAVTGGDENRDLVGPHEDGQEHVETIPLLSRHRRPLNQTGPNATSTVAPGLGVAIVSSKLGYGAFALSGRFSLLGGHCYVTDNHILTQTSAQAGGVILSPGRHVAEVTITHDRTGRARQRLVIEVPDVGSATRVAWHAVKPSRPHAVYPIRRAAP